MKKVGDFLEKQSKIIFVLSLLVFVYWILANSIDVYKYALVGVIFESVWFPFLVLFFVLPIINLVLFVKNKCSLKRIWLYGLLVNILTVLYLYITFG